MNEADANKIAALFGEVETALGEAQRVLSKLGTVMHDASDKTIYQSSVIRQAYGGAHAAVGGAIGAVVSFHQEAGRYDPRPSTQSGGGGK